ncbi:MAG: transposase [Spirochaetaceae bacterium]|jgi:transposase-like protein|nr:transposase [Spirochaetaceae bacterium]
MCHERKKSFYRKVKGTDGGIRPENKPEAVEDCSELGINQNMLMQWRQEMKQNETGSMKAFGDRGNARDKEMARLRREITDLRETV